MSDTNAYAQAYTDAFAKFVPGFDFLQGLVKNAGHALPTAGQWVAPVLDPAELERRIGELRTVQFWLEQNARMISATIQAMEVQRMTLSALQGMNVSMADLSEALKIRVPDVFGSEAAAPSPSPAPAPEAPAADATGAPAVDPMQWWGSLTQQFTQLATQAMQAASEAASQASQATTEAASQATQAMHAAGAAVADTAKAATDAVAQAAPLAAAAAETMKAAADAVVHAVPGAEALKEAVAATSAKVLRKTVPKSGPKVAEGTPAPKAPTRKAAAKKSARKSAS